jgi:hypothetical protein
MTSKCHSKKSCSSLPYCILNKSCTSCFIKHFVICYLLPVHFLFILLECHLYISSFYFFYISLSFILSPYLSIYLSIEF